MRERPGAVTPRVFREVAAPMSSMAHARSPTRFVQPLDRSFSGARRRPTIGWPSIREVVYDPGLYARDRGKSPSDEACPAEIHAGKPPRQFGGGVGVPDFRAPCQGVAAGALGGAARGRRP